MADLLLITTLDVLGRRNNREHHVIAHLAPRFDRTTVVFRRRGTPGKGLPGMLGSAQQVETIDGITYIGVDPALNPPEGTMRNFASGGARPSPVRAALGVFVDGAGLVRDWLTIRALTDASRAAIGANRPVVTEAFGPWAAAAARCLCREGLLERHVYVDRDFEPGFMNSALRRAWAARAERAAARGADLTLSIGQRLAERSARAPGAQVALSPSGVDCGLFTPALRDRPRADMVFVGQVAPWSGIEEALDALALLLPDHPQARLTVLGPADRGYQNRLRRQITGQNLDARVSWVGERPREEVAAALAGAAIGLAVFRPHPLRIHAAPLKILEYMAAGLPVLALEGSEAGDLVARSGAGLTCACSGAGIAAAVRRMMSDPQAYRRMSAAGPPTAQAHDWGQILSRELDLLRRLYDLDPDTRASCGHGAG